MPWEGTFNGVNAATAAPGCPAVRRAGEAVAARPGLCRVAVPGRRGDRDLRRRPALSSGMFEIGLGGGSRAGLKRVRLALVGDMNVGVVRPSLGTLDGLWALVADIATEAAGDSLRRFEGLVSKSIFGA